MTDVATRLERTLGAAAVRPCAELGPSFDGLSLASPADEEGVLEVLRLASTDRLRVLPIGFGSKLGWCPTAEDLPRADLLLSTRRIAGVVAFEPGDGTLTARAGSSLADLADTVEAGGLSLTPAVPTPAAATLGGVLAAGQSGIDRVRYGPSRHHVLGMQVALANGTRARTGGRLVKNVTGFDLQRLYCGSHGTLCVILEATLRLFPDPAATTALCSRPVSLAAALDTARALRALPLQPWTVLIDHIADQVELHVVLAGREEVVRWETERALEVFPRGAEPEVVHGPAARARARRLCDTERERGAWPHARVACRPSQLAHTVELWRSRCTRMRILPDLATLAAWLTDPADAPPPGGETAALAAGAARTMQALRARLDPGDVFAPRALGAARGLA